MRDSCCISIGDLTRDCLVFLKGRQVSSLGASFSSFRCFVFDIRVLRASVFVFETTHKIYLSGPFRIFCLYVILTISYLRAQTIETSSLPTDSSRPLFKQIEIFSGIRAVYINCKYFP